MSETNETTDRVEAIDEAYAQRTKALAAGREREAEREETERKEANKRRVEADEAPEKEGADEGTPLPEEARFVANPDDLRKEVTSEEEFSAGLTDGDDDLEVEEKPAKKTAAKKTASKKG